LKPKVEYNLFATLYFVSTFILVGFSIVTLVQGFFIQANGSMLIALAYYAATPLMIFASYFTFSKGYYKLRVLALART
jgi:hypothetical protein